MAVAVRPETFAEAWSSAAEWDNGVRGPVELTKYRLNPLGFFTDVLKIPRHTLAWSENDGYDGHAWDGTPDPLAATLDALAKWQNCGVESATTTGKTFTGAGIVLWFLACFENATVVTVAPKQDQLELHIWKEIGKLWPRFQEQFPTAELSSLRIRMKGNSDAWAAHGFVAGVKAQEIEGSATKAQGFHAEHMLIVFEETPGIAPAIMTAFKNTCRAPHNLRLALGNPDHQLDQLHQFCKGARTTHVIISAYDHPNVVTDDASLVPGAVSRQGIEDALHDAANDGGAENRMFKSRVRGISPAESVEALIRLAWCEDAATRYGDESLRTGKKAFGVDVANSEAGDKSALALFNGTCLVNVVAAPCPNSNVLGDQVWQKAKDLGVNPAHIGIDAIGVGAGTVNQIRGKKQRDGKTEPGALSVQALISSASPIGSAEKGPDGQTMEWVPDANRFDNLRSQMWWQLREDLRLGRIALPDDKALFAELTTPKFTDDAGKTVVESKKTIKKRLGGRSPDRADAVVYANWVRPRAQEPAPKRRIPEDHTGPIDFSTGRPKESNRDRTWERIDAQARASAAVRQAVKRPNRKNVRVIPT